MESKEIEIDRKNPILNRIIRPIDIAFEKARKERKERTCQVCGGFLFASAIVGGFVCDRCGRSQEKLNEEVI